MASTRPDPSMFYISTIYLLNLYFSIKFLMGLLIDPYSTDQKRKKFLFLKLVQNRSTLLV